MIGQSVLRAASGLAASRRDDAIQAWYSATMRRDNEELDLTKRKEVVGHPLLHAAADLIDFSMADGQLSTL